MGGGGGGGGGFQVFFENCGVSYRSDAVLFSLLSALYRIWIWAAILMYQVAQASQTPKNIVDWSFVFCFMFSLDKYALL